MDPNKSRWSIKCDRYFVVTVGLGCFSPSWVRKERYCNACMRSWVAQSGTFRRGRSWFDINRLEAAWSGSMCHVAKGP